MATYSYAVRPWMDVWSARAWTPVPCRILSSDVRHHEGDSTTYSVAVTYRYEVNGREYTGDRYDFTPKPVSGRKAVKEIVRGLRKGQERICHVNPTNPAEAVLEPGKVRDWGFGLLSLFFVLVGAGGICFAIIGPRKPGPKASEGGTRGWEMVYVRPTVSAADFSENEPDAGPVELQPLALRKVKAIALVIGAVLWNGIISLFLVDIVGDLIGGAWVMWIFLVFLLPFVGIGLYVIGLAVRQVMSLTNPVPRLTVNRRRFAPGETVELSWRFDGKAGRLKDIRLWLEGREEATYRRGTDTKTDKEVFAMLEIALATGLASGEPGQAKFRLPERLMHSFRSENNCVGWVLRVKGGIAWWPDLDEEFSFTIRPPLVMQAVVSQKEPAPTES